MKKFRYWNDFQRLQEFDSLIKDKLVRGSATCVISWEELESTMVKYMPGAQNLFQIEMKKVKKYPFSQ
jgi:hypothetical protein